MGLREVGNGEINKLIKAENLSNYFLMQNIEAQLKQS